MSTTNLAIQKHKELLQKRGYKKSLLVLVQEVLEFTEIDDHSESVHPLESQMLIHANIMRTSGVKNRPLDIGNMMIYLIQLCKKYDLDIRDCLEVAVTVDE